MLSVHFDTSLRLLIFTEAASKFHHTFTTYLDGKNYRESNGHICFMIRLKLHQEKNFFRLCNKFSEFWKYFLWKAVVFYYVQIYGYKFFSNFLIIKKIEVKISISIFSYFLVLFVLKKLGSREQFKHLNYLIMFFDVKKCEKSIGDI